MKSHSFPFIVVNDESRHIPNYGTHHVEALTECIDDLRDENARLAADLDGFAWTNRLIGFAGGVAVATVGWVVVVWSFFP